MKTIVPAFFIILSLCLLCVFGHFIRDEAEDEIFPQDEHSGSTCSAVKARIDCGYVGIKQQECEHNNCCWDSSKPKDYFCFYKGRECKSLDPTKRLDCGYYGIKEKECLTKGCCWDKSHEGVPWCFYQSCACDVVKPQDRIDCGYLGIDESECKKRECCWDNSIPGVNYCFYKGSV
ncbi:integumentary mucin C.1-like [Xenia sp. Carnegie-2017]|uniref:integumentary mucin C.1-like n=1 Tax=Xenia sp. Carnegie-2017 TaxID=2897299 RepID=UPI001F038EDD|nr:integumentary mucin C.1-like [Xenia sp. Carnegie-2017]